MDYLLNKVIEVNELNPKTPDPNTVPQNLENKKCKKSLVY